MRGITISAAAITLPWAGHQEPFSLSLPDAALIFLYPANRREKSADGKKFVAFAQRTGSSVVDRNPVDRVGSAVLLEAEIRVKGWIRI
jgi:hypothetical protein